LRAISNENALRSTGSRATLPPTHKAPADKPRDECPIHSSFALDY